MSRPIVLYDACVLYPAPLRDLLMHLAMTDLFKAQWTNEIHEEWIRNVLKNRPDLTRKQLERTRTLMNECVLDCLVVGYEKLISKLKLPDVNDRHVLAAAIHAEASIILTFNLKDFPAKITREYGVAAKHPDDFLCTLVEADPLSVCDAVQRLRSGLKKPPMTLEQYLDVLNQQSLVKFVAKLKKFQLLALRKKAEIGP